MSCQANSFGVVFNLLFKWNRFWFSFEKGWKWVKREPIGWEVGFRDRVSTRKQKKNLPLFLLLAVKADHKKNDVTHRRTSWRSTHTHCLETNQKQKNGDILLYVPSVGFNSSAQKTGEYRINSAHDLFLTLSYALFFEREIVCDGGLIYCDWVLSDEL